jgi:hypothetical protein
MGAMNGAHIPAAPRNVAASDQDVLLRLALWLADVATEATLVASAPAAVARRPAGRADEPPVVESAS